LPLDYEMKETPYEPMVAVSVKAAIQSSKPNETTAGLQGLTRGLLAVMLILVSVMYAAFY